MTALDWSVVAAYGAVLVWITIRARRTRSLDDFTVASRDTPRGMVFASLAATYIGPGFCEATAGREWVV
jgi:Na+/proline symporter